MRYYLFYFLVFLSLGLVLSCTGKSKSNSEKTSNQRVPVAESLANGQRQYHLRGCVKCHGVLGDGKGTKAGRYPADKLPRNFKDLSSYQQGYELENIIYSIRNGIVDDPNNLMPKFPFLVDEEVQHIAQYVVYLRTNELSPSSQQ